MPCAAGGRPLLVPHQSGYQPQGPNVTTETRASPGLWEPSIVNPPPDGRLCQLDVSWQPKPNKVAAMKTRAKCGAGVGYCTTLGCRVWCSSEHKSTLNRLSALAWRRSSIAACTVLRPDSWSQASSITSNLSCQLSRRSNFGCCQTM